MTPITSTLPAPQTTARAAKYLTFALADETYAVDIVKVREIIAYAHVTAVPGVAGHVKGVINLRGQVISVIDLRERFGMPPVQKTSQTCIIIVDGRTRDAATLTGLIVDRVLDVAAINPNDIEDASALGDALSGGFVCGVCTAGDAVKILIEVDNIVAPGTLA